MRKTMKAKGNTEYTIDLVKKLSFGFLKTIPFKYKMTITIIIAMVVDTICVNKNLSMFIVPNIAGKKIKPPAKRIISDLSSTDSHASVLNHWLAVIIFRKKRKKNVRNWIAITPARMSHRFTPDNTATTITIAVYRTAN